MSFNSFCTATVALTLMFFFRTNSAGVQGTVRTWSDIIAAAKAASQVRLRGTALTHLVYQVGKRIIYAADA